MIQEFFFFDGNRSTNPDEALAFFVAGRYFAVHGVEDSWWCDDEADRVVTQQLTRMKGQQTTPYADNQPDVLTPSVLRANAR